MRHTAPLLVCLFLTGPLSGCGDKDSAAVEVPACGLADDHASCNECYSGEVTCTYGDESATAGSCGDCQARGALYAALCEAGVADSREALEAGTSCSDPT